jgi:hypothetical protein
MYLCFAHQLPVMDHPMKKPGKHSAIGGLLPGRSLDVRYLHSNTLALLPVTMEEIRDTSPISRKEN